MTFTVNVPEWFVIFMAVLFPIALLVHGIRDYYKIKLQRWSLALTVEQQRMENQLKSLKTSSTEPGE